MLASAYERAATACACSAAAGHSFGISPGTTPRMYWSRATVSTIWSVFAIVVARSSPRKPLPSSVRVEPLPGANGERARQRLRLAGDGELEVGLEHDLTRGQRRHDARRVGDGERAVDPILTDGRPSAISTRTVEIAAFASVVPG